MPGFRKYAATVAIFASGLFLALLIAAFGVISLLSGTEVIADRRAGELAGPVAAAAATLLVIGCLLLIALRVPESRQRVAPLAAAGIGVGAYLAWALFAALAFLLGRGDPVGRSSSSAACSRARSRSARESSPSSSHCSTRWCSPRASPSGAAPAGRGSATKTNEPPAARKRP
ncbi:hypothetical protein GCM10022288_20120 [Gryllotalpicola kribbensis]|uniref:Uncharacterized protein n=1 Tax=Gryllotalpicola kribbensis TaxID=993084 RepID=A0ABP8AUA8_9MICO